MNGLSRVTAIVPIVPTFDSALACNSSGAT